VNANLRTTIFAALLSFAGAGATAAPFDDLFVRHEAQSRACELALARLGQTRAIRPAVRAYAGLLVNDHEVYGGGLRRLAESKGIAVPSGFAASDRKRFDALA
jgi:putative membrane protein